LGFLVNPHPAPRITRRLCANGRHDVDNRACQVCLLSRYHIRRLAVLTVNGAARSDKELAINIQKATSPDETAPKRKHVRSCIVYTWDNKSSLAFWAGMKVYGALSPSSRSVPFANRQDPCGSGPARRYHILSASGEQPLDGSGNCAYLETLSREVWNRPTR